MAHLESGDTLEVVANNLDYDYLTEIFAEWKSFRMDWKTAQQQIGLHVLNRLNEYHDKHCLPTAQDLADARECDKSHARRDRLSEVA